MDMSGLPMFWLAFLGDPSDSGRIHSNVRERWLKGKYRMTVISCDIFYSPAHLKCFVVFN